MSEKYDNLFKELKEKCLVSLYRNRIMFYSEGFGEIQFWDLKEISANVLMLENSGVGIFFDRWEFNGSYLHVFRNDVEVGDFKLPSPSKITSNHNHFYVDEFAITMSEFLDANVAEKGDWTYCNYDQVIDLLKKNIENINNKEKIQKSCVDIANFAMMAYYLNSEEQKDNK